MIGSTNNNLGINRGQGLQGLQGFDSQQGGTNEATALLKQIKQLLENMQAQGGQEAGKAQGGQQAGGSAASGGAGEDLEALLKKLKEMAQKNPAGLQAALAQNPQMAAMLSQGLASANSGGGAGGIATG